MLIGPAFRCGMDAAESHDGFSRAVFGMTRLFRILHEPFARWQCTHSILQLMSNCSNARSEHNDGLEEDLRDLRRFIYEALPSDVRGYYLSLLDAACRKLELEYRLTNYAGQGVCKQRMH
jgi:hypothetical protein